ncbi:hypothetical protein ACIGFK_41090 [Streptomyces sp. NPDC085524]|uniref:hypothetical protein n=1 Tax=Streptomyces sp. NPDC085524 TaxID=3365728 RepID=UPI0037D44F81
MTDAEEYPQLPKISGWRVQDPAPDRERFSPDDWQLLIWFRLILNRGIWDSLRSTERDGPRGPGGMRANPLVKRFETLSKWLSGNARPSEETLHDFCNAFNQAVRVAGVPDREITPEERAHGVRLLKAAVASPEVRAARAQAGELALTRADRDRLEAELAGVEKELADKSEELEAAAARAREAEDSGKRQLEKFVVLLLIVCTSSQRERARLEQDLDAAQRESAAVRDSRDAARRELAQLRDELEQDRARLITLIAENTATRPAVLQNVDAALAGAQQALHASSQDPVARAAPRSQRVDVTSSQLRSAGGYFATRRLMRTIAATWPRDEIFLMVFELSLRLDPDGTPTTGLRLARQLQRHARVRYYELDEQFRGAGPLRKAWFGMRGIRVQDVLSLPSGLSKRAHTPNPPRPGELDALLDRADRP